MSSQRRVNPWGLGRVNPLGFLFGIVLIVIAAWLQYYLVMVIDVGPTATALGYPPLLAALGLAVVIGSFLVRSRMFLGPKSLDPRHPRCPNCNRRITSDMATCPSCGVKVNFIKSRVENR